MTRAEKAQILQWVAEDLTNAWAYVRSHPQEIDQDIRENEDA